MLNLYELYRLHISDQNLWTSRIENHQKMARCVVTNTKREVLVLVDFQDNYYSIDYWIIY